MSPGPLTVGLVQTTTGLDPDANATALVASAGRLADAGAKIVFTPEMSGLLDRDRARLLATSMPEDAEPTLAAMRALAVARGIHVALGSLAIRARDSMVNRSYLIGPDGALHGTYDKIHLFDVDLPDGQRIRESATFTPGTRATLAPTPWGPLGLTVCYDLRFPGLYAALARAGAVMLAVPAAFTIPTGRAHWHTLLRARAIETGCFVIAAAQTGRHQDGRDTWGHSLVVDPWGEVLLDMGDAPGEALVTLDLARVAWARERIPALAHARPIAFA